MKILIIGATGQLGSYLFEEAAKKHEVIGTYVKNEKDSFIHLDISDKKEAFEVFKKVKPDVAILTAAMTWVDYCEEHKDEAYKINVVGVKNVTEACKRYNAKMVFISTYYLFDGKRGVYFEEDAPNPLNYYAKTKLEAEKIVKRVLKNYLIIRTSKLFSVGRDSRNFASRLIKNLRDKKITFAQHDQLNNPIWAKDAAEIIIKLIEKEKRGVYNIGTKSALSNYDFALKIAETFGLDKKLIKKVNTTQSKVARPLKCILNTNKVERELHINIPSVDEELKKIREVLK